VQGVRCRGGYGDYLVVALLVEVLPAMAEDVRRLLEVRVQGRGFGVEG
jgi:hypothetical protein